MRPKILRQMRIIDSTSQLREFTQDDSHHHFLLFFSPALSRHRRRTSQHRQEYRGPILHGGPQHPHPHSQSQQLQRDVGVHARTQGSADASQQTRGVIGAENSSESFDRCGAERASERRSELASQGAQCK